MRMEIRGVHRKIRMVCGIVSVLLVAVVDVLIGERQEGIGSFTEKKEQGRTSLGERKNPGLRPPCFAKQNINNNNNK